MRSLIKRLAVFALVVSILGVFAPAALAATPGTVIAWGDNCCGQTKLPANLTDVIAISAGQYYAAALKSDGTVVAWGDNSAGQTNVPDGLTGVTAISAGTWHILALKSDGTVVAWGDNTYGQTNVPDGLTDVTAIAAGWPFNLALKRDGTVVAWGLDAFGVVSGAAGLTDVAKIAAAGQHAVALKRDGTVVAWGWNNLGQASVPDGLAQVTAIAAGFSHTIALKRDGTVVAWGGNTSGQTNVPAGLTGVTAIAAGAFHNLALKSDGTVVAWGHSTYGQTNVPADLLGVTAIAGGSFFSMALTTDVRAPVAAPLQSPAANAAGWNNTDVTVSWNWADNPGGSGLDLANCTPSSASSGEGEQTLSATCADLDGNRGSASSTVKVDKTAPTISAAATTSPNAAGWYNSDVTVRFTCADATSGIASGACPPNQLLSTDGAAVSSSAQTVSDRAGNQSAPSNVVTVKIDRSAPTISAAATTAHNNAGWYNSDVTVVFSCADALSGVASCTAAQTLTGEGSAVSSTAQAISDRADNQSTPSNVVTVKIDRTAPAVAVTGVSEGATYTAGAVPTPVCSTSDALSGVATPASVSVSGTGVGSYTATCVGATDNAGNAAPAVSVSYTIGYGFEGFFSPVDNLPTVNSANAGRTIPLKWRVTDASGNPVTTLASVSVTSVAGGCSANAPADTVEEYATSNTGLQNLGDGYYQFNWKTEKSWAGSCRTLRLDLGDGVVHSALFQFR